MISLLSYYVSLNFVEFKLMLVNVMLVQRNYSHSIECQLGIFSNILAK